LLQKLRYEEMLPDELREAIATAPVAYVPCGSLEWHGYHLPVGNDALKVQAICLRLAAEVGGAVLPPVYFGVGGGHTDYFASVICDEAHVEPLLVRLFDCLARDGFRVIVVLTGHYPGEQVAMVRRAAATHMAEAGSATVMALPEYEAYPEEPRRGDHAAKWETSLLMALRPELVEMSRLTDGREDPLHGVFGEDPRAEASTALGEETVSGIVAALAARIREVLWHGPAARRGEQ
jgi:creatinine amidohydrolase